MDNNLNSLISYIEQLIYEEKKYNSDIQFLETSHAKLIAQILSNYSLQNNANSNEKNPKIKLCKCEKYTHYNCLKQKVKNIGIKKNKIIG